MVEHHPIRARDQSRLHQVAKKASPGIFLGYALIAGGSWKGDVLVADIEELENMDASEIPAKRLGAKEVLTPQKKKRFYISKSRWYSNLLWKRPRIPRTHSKAGTNRKGVRISVDNFKANGKSLN